MGNTNGAPRPVARALEEVSEWKSGALDARATELAEVDQEIEKLQEALVNLQQQIESMTAHRKEVVDQGPAIELEEVQRSYEAIFDALAEQSAALAERAALVSEAEKVREQALEELMRDSAVAPLLTEYEQFKSSVEPTLDSLPESYRSVILDHHGGVVKKLREHVERVTSGPTQIEAEVLEFDVVYAVDAPEGEPGLLMLVLPVDASVQVAWTEREEDLQTWVAARVVQSVYRACHELGMVGVQAMFGPHKELLAVELELVDSAADKVGETLARHLEEGLGEAAELTAARLALSPAAVGVDHLLPPEDPQEEIEGGDQ